MWFHSCLLEDEQKFKFGVCDECQFCSIFTYVFVLILSRFYVNFVYYMFILYKTEPIPVRGWFDDFLVFFSIIWVSNQTLTDIWAKETKWKEQKDNFP